MVGSRKGVERNVVEAFIHSLAREQPDTIVVSGGAVGVDTFAERRWLALGGAVVSYRIHKITPESWGIEEWQIGGREVQQIVKHDIPTFANPESALFFRSTMIVDGADRVVAFTNPRFSPGTRFTKAYAKDRGVPVYEMVSK